MWELCVRFLFYLLLKFLKILGVENFGQGYAKDIANHLDRNDTRVYAFSVKNVLIDYGNYRLLHSKLVDRHFSLPKQLQNSIFYRSIDVRFTYPSKNKMFRADYSPKLLTNRAIYDTINYK